MRLATLSRRLPELTLEEGCPIGWDVERDQSSRAFPPRTWSLTLIRLPWQASCRIENHVGVGHVPYASPGSVFLPVALNDRLNIGGVEGSTL